MNAVEIEEAITELAEQPFDADTFPFAFLEAFDNKATTIRRLRSGTTNKSDCGGVLQTNNIHIAVADKGAATAILDTLRQSQATTRAKAKFILATDGEDFEAEDLTSGETVACAYADFPDHFGFFLPLAGITTVKQVRENAFDIRATKRLNQLYTTLLSDNPDWADAEHRETMNHFMARLIFCFFAEDTSIFEGSGLFTDTVEQMSMGDASNTADVIAEIFRAMDLDIPDRKDQDLPRWADKFPYVNGGLFAGSVAVPYFSKVARSYLTHIGKLDWQQINPDIFGSMIQAVADDEERGELGMHYTSVPNILKVLNPLFLDDLRQQLKAAGDNGRKLLNLRKRMARIRVFDPACGSGNFLVIAYREMRGIENTINERRGESERKTDIPLTNFRGIEMRHFSAEVARLALVIAEYQCNVRYLGQIEALKAFLPLEDDNWVTCGNALRLDWLSICPPTGSSVEIVSDDLLETPLDQAEIDFENKGGETYICGNPPYTGSQWRTKAQQDDMDFVFGCRTRSYRDLDYVAAWFLKASEFGKSGSISVAFVATKTITQGRQVSMLWPLIFGSNMAIFFAHRPFDWKNLAAKNAGVTVVIVGITNGIVSNRFIYDGATKKVADNINAYLLDAENIIVRQESRPINGLPSMDYGNKPSDGGHLILKNDEKNSLIENYPETKRFIRKYIGSREFTSSSFRWCIWILNDEIDEALKVPPVKDRIEAVKAARAASKGAQARSFAEYGHCFVYAPHREGVHALIVPSITTDSRDYLPVGVVKDDAIVSNKAAVIYDPPIWTLSLIASRLHEQWVGNVCVRMRMGYSYSNTLGWNTFPVPTLTQKTRVI